MASSANRTILVRVPLYSERRTGSKRPSVWLLPKDILDLLVRISNRGDRRWRFVIPHDVGLVNRLFFWGAPSAVERRLVVLGIYPVQRRVTRPRPQIMEKVLKALTIRFKPSVADTNTFASPLFIEMLTVLVLLIAARTH